MKFHIPQNFYFDDSVPCIFPLTPYKGNQSFLGVFFPFLYFSKPITAVEIMKLCWAISKPAEGAELAYPSAAVLQTGQRHKTSCHKELLRYR